MHHRGRYIVVEGLEGSGKSTQAQLLVQHLGPGTLHIREPGGTYLGERLRELMKNEDILRSHRANMFLFMSARANLADLCIGPTLKTGNTVVSDRNWLSTLAYQAVEGADTDQIVALSKLAMGEYLEPDLLILIDTDAAACLRRTRTRVTNAADSYDYFGRGALKLFRQIRENYLREIGRFKNGVIVDGNRSADEVWKQIRDVVDAHSGAMERSA